MPDLNEQDFIKSSSFINGQWLETTGSKQFTVTDPATGEIITHLADATADDARQAIQAATDALPAWRALPADERARRLKRWQQLQLDNLEPVARLLSREQGKPLQEARGEIAYGASYMEWYAEEAKRVYGDTIPAPSADKRILVLKQPVGVVTAVTPWNFPNAMIARKAAAALAAGCTFVVKPADETPLSALAMAELARLADIPDGVFNVVCGTDKHAIGEVLTQDPRVAKFSFTGSTAVGKLLATQCASTIKKVSLELGGNAPFIVFDDADLDAAIEGLMACKYRNAGQTCVSSNRLLVQESILDEFTRRLVAEVDRLKVGHGLEPDTQVGPLISETACHRIEQSLAESVSQGARLLTGGSRINDGGTFFQPTVISGVENHMPIACAEIFGPVIPVLPFKDEQKAIELANDTRSGLAAYFYTRDLARSWRVSEALEYGIVGINEGIISNPAAPFGGVKESGIGREGSKYGLDDYLEIKYVCIGGL